MLGQFQATLQLNDNIVQSKVYVINKEDSSCLLRKDSALKLQIVQLEEKIEVVNHVSKEIEDILHVNEEIFEGVGKLRKFQLRLHIKEDVKPVAQTTRRVAHHLQNNVIEKIRELEALDIIEETRGPTNWVSPLVVTPKKNGDIRVIVDMRRANEAIERERHPIPTLEQVKQEINNAMLFSKKDLRMGYHQLELHEGSRPITTFSTPISLRRFKGLALGVTSASECYQHTLEQKVTCGLKGVKNISDDIIVWGKSTEEHHENLKALLRRIQELGLTLNKKKTVWAVDSIKFFSIILSKEGAKADPEKVNSINNMKEPTSTQELRSFLGLATYMSGFIKNFSHVVEPLRQGFRKNSSFNPIPTVKKAFWGS